MIAVVVASSSSPMFSVLGLAVFGAVVVLAAHWGSFRPQVKRMVMASLIAFTCATVAVRAEEFIYVPIDWCWVYTLNPDDWYAWLRCVVQAP